MASLSKGNPDSSSCCPKSRTTHVIKWEKMRVPVKQVLAVGEYWVFLIQAHMGGRVCLRLGLWSAQGYMGAAGVSQAGILVHWHVYECYGGRRCCGQALQNVVWEQFLISCPLSLDFACGMSAENVDHVTALGIKRLPHDHMTTNPLQWSEQ